MTYQRTALAREERFTTRAEDGNFYLEGYFAVFGSRYELWEGAYETIEPGAFDGETGGDVRALINHDSTLVLGRTLSGSLRLRVDERGLWGSITINQADQDAMNLYERVKRGDVSQCSFGFDILEQEMEYEDGEPTVWRIQRVRLYEVSVVTFPAYEDTSIQARKKDWEALHSWKKEQWREQMRNRLKGA